jgi:hypothetical protein
MERVMKLISRATGRFPPAANAAEILGRELFALQVQSWTNPAVQPRIAEIEAELGIVAARPAEKPQGARGRR